MLDPEQETVRALRARTHASGDQRDTPSGAANTDNALGTGLGDRYRAPQVHSGRFEEHVEQDSKAA
jgi:hypothetical protein